MHLSQLKLNTYRRATRELRLNPYLVHQAVLRAFPDSCDGGPGRVLYRMDTDRNGNAKLLIQSQKMPDWAKAGLLAECLEERPAPPIDYPPFLKPGQSLYFRLRANPTVKKQAPGRDNGYRVGLWHEEDQMAWLKRKAEAGGFAVLRCRVLPEGTILLDKSSEANKVRHFAVIFEGILRVTQMDLFLQAIENGIGSAKGFGFGLLSIAPVKGGPT